MTSKSPGAEGELQAEIARLRQRLADAEAAAQRSENLLQTLVDSLPFDFFLIDRSGRYIMQNTKACELWGTLLGRRPAEMAPNAETRALWQRNNDRAFAGETVREEVETHYGDDTLHLFNIIAPVRDGDEVVAILGVNIDITDRKRAEQEKSRLEALYHQAQRLEAIGTLAGGIAHNFNNILMAIEGHVSLMLAAPPDSGPDLAALREIEQQVHNGAQLTAQLLGYARRGDVEVKPLDLNALVWRTARTVAQTRREIEVSLDCTVDPLVVEGDTGQLEQVLMNILVNATDAMPEGGRLTVATAKTAQREMVGLVHDPAAGDYAAVTVADEGVGIDQATRGRIFEPFFTTKGQGRGTGLGLASAYGIVRNHHGHITVRPRQQQGTVFTVFLPLTDAPLPAELRSEPTSNGGSGTVLLVDDEPVVLQVGTAMLEHLGYEVLRAEDGARALELFAGAPHRVDLVILDMVMPSMAGGEVFDRLREIEPGVKVLLSSGYGPEGRARELLDRGCDGFLQKPFDLKELSTKIRSLLTGRADDEASGRPPDPGRKTS